MCPHLAWGDGWFSSFKIFVDLDAKPVTHLNPGFILLHQYDLVVNNIKQDIAMGVLEPHPLNKPVTWCQWILICNKHDGTPRRTINMSPLNRVCLREPQVPSPSSIWLNISLKTHERLLRMHGMVITVFRFVRKRDTWPRSWLPCYDMHVHHKVYYSVMMHIINVLGLY